MRDAVQEYIRDVSTGEFPDSEHSYHLGGGVDLDEIKNG
jgi:ketopantoate hydroxymethyltransferase